MNVGLATYRFRLYAVQSLKEKRSIVRRLVADVRRRGAAFAACEAGDHDDLRRLTLCVAHVSNDPRLSTAALATLQGELERGDGYEIAESRIEIR